LSDARGNRESRCANRCDASRGHAQTERASAKGIVTELQNNQTEAICRSARTSSVEGASLGGRAGHGGIGGGNVSARPGQVESKIRDAVESSIEPLHGEARAFGQFCLLRLTARESDRIPVCRCILCACRGHRITPGDRAACGWHSDRVACCPGGTRS